MRERERETDRKREQEKARVYKCERESVTVLPKALDMTHALKPQTAWDQIQSGPTQAVISLRAAIHDTSYSFTGHGHKCRRAKPKVHGSLLQICRHISTAETNTQ